MSPWNIPYADFGNCLIFKLLWLFLLCKIVCNNFISEHGKFTPMDTGTKYCDREHLSKAQRLRLISARGHS